jgi:hypothetical protein
MKMKSRKANRTGEKKKKTAGANNAGTAVFTVSLPLDIYKQAEKDAAYFGLPIEGCLSMLLKNVVEDLAIMAQEQKQENGETFDFPSGCAACSNSGYTCKTQ